MTDPRGGWNRYRYNASFFKSWTKEMAYVLGYLYADGCVMDARSSRTQYMTVISKDRESIELIKQLLSPEHSIIIRKPIERKYPDGKIYRSSYGYILRIGSRELYKDLCTFGLHPNKSKSILFPSVPAGYLSDFVRGYFDGDGCVFLNFERGVTGERMLKKLVVIFTSGSDKFLEGLDSILAKTLSINRKRIYRSQGAFQIRYTTGDSIKIFKLLYQSCPPGLYLERKLKIFKEYFNLRPNRVDSEVASVLNALAWPGARAARERSAKPFYMGANPIQAS